MSEEPTKVLPTEHASSHLPDLPLFDNIPDTQPKGIFLEKQVTKEDILSKQDLVDQTYDFMTMFGKLAKKGENPDTVFFTLKSAIPIARMMKKMWENFYPEVTMPQIRFIDIGRVKVSEIEPTYNFRTDEVNYTHHDPKIDGTSVEDIQHAFSDNIDTRGRILVVDEYSESGKTIQEAEKRLKEAFPDAIVSTNVVYKKMPHWNNQPSYLGLRDADIHDREHRARHIVNVIAFNRYLADHQIDPEKEGWKQTPGKWLEEYNKWFDGENEDQHGIPAGYEDESDMMGSKEKQDDFQQYLALLETFKHSPYDNVTHPEEGDEIGDFNPDFFALAREEESNICAAVVAKLKENSARG